MKLDNLHKALEDGATLHGFRSGGGLRVFRVDNGPVLLGYGEHPQAQDALAHTELWLEKCPEYEDFYGKKFPHYYTGSSSSGNCVLDQWLLKGNTIDVTQKGGIVVVQLNGDRLLDPKPIRYGTGTNFWEALESAFAEGEKP